MRKSTAGDGGVRKGVYVGHDCNSDYKAMKAMQLHTFANQDIQYSGAYDTYIMSTQHSSLAQELTYQLSLSALVWRYIERDIIKGRCVA